MKPAAATSKLSARSNAVLIALFAVLLWLPTVDELFHVDRAVAYGEKRSLAELPDFKFGLRGVKNYIAGLQSCFNDRFGFRLRLLRWYNQGNYRLFGNRVESGVIKGSDGWLFYAKEDMVQQYRGAHQFTPQDLFEWQRLLENRRDWLAARGIHYIFVVAPDKQSIYSDQLPAWLAKARPETKLDQFLAHMRAHSTVDVLDLRLALRQAGRTAPTYLKTDTHWNFFGGYVAYQEIVRALSKQLPALEPLPLNRFHLRNEPGAGDLAGMLGLDPDEIAEDNRVLFAPKSDLPPLETNFQFNNAHFNFSRNSLAQNNMIFFHDSFGLAVEPFLGYHFAKVVCPWQNTMDPKLIEQEKPVVVVTEMVERLFNSQNPMDLMAEDGLKSGTSAIVSRVVEKASSSVAN
ncbi:MAG TPA: alginate O-acetyltransferase [Verrucomicrobiae bacterium]|nr:alginate O-acetyltransferase [Verrucomicrobiae bacterium]